MDTTAPAVTLLGPNPQTIECHTSYTELGATASDVFAGNLTSAVVINAAAVNVNSIGTYQVTYTVTDGHNSTTVNRSVHVADTVSPTLTPCPSPITVPPEPGQTTARVSWMAPTVSDECGAVLVCMANGVAVTSPTTFPLGTTTVTCKATDGGGNVASCAFTDGAAAVDVMVLMNGPPNHQREDYGIGPGAGGE